MKCASSGRLRTYADGELEDEQRTNVERHLESCGVCTAELERIVGRGEETRRRLQVLESGDLEAADPVFAYRQYRAHFGGNDKAEGWSDLFHSWWRHPAWGAAAGVCLLAVVFSFAPARTWGQRVLEMLRVQRLAVVPVDEAALQRAGIGNGGKLAQLISDDVVVTLQPGAPGQVASVGEASARAGFTVKTLEGWGAPDRIQVQDEAAFHTVLDADRIRAVLTEAGRTDIAIPDSINGSTVAVHVPKGVEMRYGKCGPGGNDCVDFRQVPSPTVSVPPNLNINELAQAGLQLAGMSAQQAQDFANGIDWASTLVIPIPSHSGSWRTEPVDGVEGKLLEEQATGQCMLLWVKNGVVYALNGKSSAVLNAANGLKE